MATMRSKLLQLRGLNALNLEQHKPRIDMGWTQGAGDAKLGFLVNMIGIGAFAGCALGLGALLPKPVSLGIAAAALGKFVAHVWSPAPSVDANSCLLCS